jgi:hypothetical protein
MKRIITLFVLLLVFLGSAFSTATITGKISNSQSSEIVLLYNGGCYSMPAKYYNPEDLYETPDKNNEFEFVLETSKDYCCYNLSVNGNGCNIYIKDNDSIYISFNPAHLEETFMASGKGSGLTNFMFAYNAFFLSYPPEGISDKEVITYYNPQNNSFLKLLESFKKGKIQADEGINIKQQTIINKLINANKLSPVDYKLLENYSNKFISDDIYFTSYEYQLSHIDDFIDLFKNTDFHNNFIIHDPCMQNLVIDYVRISCYKKYVESHDSIAIHKAHEYFLIHKFAMAKELLSGEVLQKYMADDLYNLLLNGNYEEFKRLYNQYNMILTDDLYKNVIEEFRGNYLTAQENKKYLPDLKNCLLNSSTLKLLIDSLKGRIVYLVLWKINRETSYYLTPLSKLHVLNELHSSSINNNIRFIDICLADDTSRQHWASLIVQYHWKGEHYFISDKFGDELRNIFNCRDRMNYCSSELYYLLDKEGNILVDNNDELIVKSDE